MIMPKNKVRSMAHSPRAKAVVANIVILVTGFLAIHVYFPSFSFVARKVKTEPAITGDD